MFKLLIFALLSFKVHAVPNNLFARATACARDNCYRAVFGSTPATRSTQGASDCASYFLRTVSLCAPTISSTSTSTSTVNTTTVLSTAMATVTSTFYSAPPAITLIVTSVSSTTVTPATTSTVLTTSISTSTVAQTTTSTIIVSDFDGEFVQINKRATTCFPTTQSPSAIPAYASDCATSSRFSSVCACNGITSSTKTVTPAASTTTVLSIQTVIATITSVTTSTSTISVTVASPVTVSSTTVSVSTFTAPASVVSTTSTVTSTTVTTTTTAVTVTETAVPSDEGAGGSGNDDPPPSSNSCGGYATPNGDGYEIHCNTAYAHESQGRNMVYLTLNGYTSVQSCINTCEDNSNHCVAVDFDKVGQVCYLLQTTALAQSANPDHDSAEQLGF